MWFNFRLAAIKSKNQKCAQRFSDIQILNYAILNAEEESYDAAAAVQKR